jgi:hypothetical protein
MILEILDNKIIDSIVNDRELIDMLSPDPDPWIGHFLKGYVDKNNKVKGGYGEKFVSKLMTSLGYAVYKAENKGHDRLISTKTQAKVKVEIKFAAAHRNAKNKGTVNNSVFSFNHFGINKDWNRGILIGVNPGETYSVWFFKEDLIEHINSSDNLFSRQQGGKKGNNDDWMFMTNPNNWAKFINLPWVKSLEEW